MKKLKLIIELEFDDDLMYKNDRYAKMWFFDSVLLDKENEGITLHSSHIGDEIGTVKVLKILGF